MERGKMDFLSRRDFLKLSAAGLTAILLNKTTSVFADFSQLPSVDNLGRCFATTNIHAKPNIDSEVINTLFEDNIVVINRELVGTSDSRLLRSKTWYETDAGYIYAPNIQPVKNLENPLLESLPNYGTEPGFWAEVTVPYVDLILDGSNPQSPLLKEWLEINKPPRFYFSQVLWIDGIKTSDDGKVLYHIIEKHGSYGDKFWADARAFKLLTPEELSPIDPEIENKSIVVDVSHQKLSCFEGSREILYTTVSTGALHNNEGLSVDAWSTPVGDYFAVNRKFISLHMGGGNNKASGYEDFAVSYSSIFATGGVALHSTYWHNAWGSPMSHGCVNLKPDDAKFIYRWTQPSTPYEDGKIEQEGYAGTSVRVIEF